MPATAVHTGAQPGSRTDNHSCIHGAGAFQVYFEEPDFSTQSSPLHVGHMSSSDLLPIMDIEALAKADTKEAAWRSGT